MLPEDHLTLKDQNAMQRCKQQLYLHSERKIDYHPLLTETTYIICHHSIHISQFITNVTSNYYCMYVNIADLHSFITSPQTNDVTR